MVELKVASAYNRRYRDYLGRWVTSIGTIRAIASSGSIAAWALWKDYAFVWASIIAVSQVLDALKEVFPVTKRHKAASEHANSLGTILIDAQLEWEKIFMGIYTEVETVNLRHKLMKLQHDAERTNFPDGLSERASDFALAQQEAMAYFRTTYGSVVNYN